MIVGGLDALPRVTALIERVQKLREERLAVDDVPIHWEFSTSNHFIDVCRVEPLADVALPEFAFIGHFAGDELRGQTAAGPGLYYEESDHLRAVADTVDTPFGACHILTGDRAREYFDFYRYVDDFSQRKRLLAAERIFGDCTVIANETHQGLLNLNELVLGCHPVPQGCPNALMPLVLRSDLPAYLVRGKPNLTPDRIEALGFRQRALDLGVYERLSQANVVPHGGGYVFEHLLDVISVYEVNGARYFELDLQNDCGRKVLANVRDIPYQYRGREVASRTFELGLAEPVARLTLVYAMKV